MSWAQMKKHSAAVAQIVAAVQSTKGSASDQIPFRELYVSRHLADKYRNHAKSGDGDWYVDDTYQQIADDLGMSARQVRSAITSLTAAEVWKVTRKGRKNAGGTRRVPGPVWEDETTTDTEITGDRHECHLKHEITGDIQQITGDIPSFTGDTPGMSLPNTYPIHTQSSQRNPDRNHTDGSTSHRPNKAREEEKKKEPQHKQVSDIFEQAAKLAAETRASNGWSQLGSKKMAQNAEQARSKWNLDANRWLQLGASTSAVISAIAERINDNPDATPRDLDRDYSDHGPSCGCRDCKPDLHPTGCDCIDCEAAGLQHIAALDDSTPIAPPEHIRALLAQGIGQRTTTTNTEGTTS